MKGLAAGALLLTLAGLGPARAEDATDLASLADRLALSGSVRAGYWSSDRKLDDTRNFTPASVWLKAAPDFGNGFSARAEAWAYDERPLAGRTVDGELREGFVAWHGENLSFDVGRRIIVWGRADKINPTDVISSRDYTLLFPEDDDQRRGNLMATGSWAFGDFTARLLWLPEFRPNIIPIPQFGGVHLLEQGDRFDAAQGALRLDHTGGGLDWALSYFDGIDRNPDFRITNLDAAGLSVSTVHRRSRTIGADIAGNLGDYGLRGEVAYTDPEQRQASDAFDKHPFLFAVLGIDRNVTEHLHVDLQYVVHYVTDYSDPRLGPASLTQAVAVQGALVNNQLVQTQHGPTLHVQYYAFNDTLMLELQAAGYASDGSSVVRPKASYAITDNLKATVGADFFFGTADSFYGQLKKNRTGYFELKYGF
jgi:hypothetical protein